MQLREEHPGHPFFGLVHGHKKPESSRPAQPKNSALNEMVDLLFSLALRVSMFLPVALEWVLDDEFHGEGNDSMHLDLRLLATIGLLLLVENCAGAEPKEGQTVTKEERAGRSDISADEEVVFYPTYGSHDEERGTWTLPIHGIIYEPESDSRRRGAFAVSIRKALGLEADDTKSEFLDRRLRLFLVDNERDQEIFVRIGDHVYGAGTSEANGHFRRTIVLADGDVERLVETDVDGDWLLFEAVARPTDRRKFKGRVQLIEPAGVSIISDIDDTIKHSEVGDRKALLANTFLRKFKPAEGMPGLYRQCAELAIAFHYVSGSPWQLYLPLAEFLEAEEFPKGSVHLKQFRLKDRSIVSVLQSQEATKLGAIEPILAAYPERRFILIGDSGEQDPEIYAKVAKKYGKQVVAVFIRNVTGEGSDDPRFLAVQEQLGDVRFQLFEESESLLPVIREIHQRANSPR